MCCTWVGLCLGGRVKFPVGLGPGHTLEGGELIQPNLLAIYCIIGLNFQEDHMYGMNYDDFSFLNMVQPELYPQFIEYGFKSA